MPTYSSTNLLKTAALAVGAFAVSFASASAQTTLVLNAPVTQVTDAMIQGGTSANTNFNKSDMVATRASANVEYLRRALLKFDTQTTLPADSTIQSATMTLTVKTAGSDASRTIGVFPVTTSFVQEEVTWNLRRVSTKWTSAGGDLGSEGARQDASNIVGAKVSFNVKTLVQAAVKGANASRYTRLALADLGSSTNTSYREYFSSKAIDPSVRPVLTVVYGGSAPPVVVPPVQPPGAGATLRVLQYNTHHGGYGTDNVFSTERIANWVVKSNADVVSLQEIEVKTSWSLGLDDTVIYQNLLQQKTGQTWYKLFFSLSGASSGIGDLILSKYPFVATGHLLLSGGRSAVDATIDVNGRIVNVTSAHLDSVQQSNRIKEVSEILAWETTLAENRIIVGDFNAWPNTDEIASMTNDYTDTWAASAAAGTAISWPANPSGITHSYHRIDYIFQSKKATALTLQSVTVFDTSDHSTSKCIVGCFADSIGIDPSDHRPVLAVFDVR